MVAQRLVVVLSIPTLEPVTKTLEISRCNTIIINNMVMATVVVVVVENEPIIWAEIMLQMWL